MKTVILLFLVGYYSLGVLVDMAKVAGWKPPTLSDRVTDRVFYAVIALGITAIQVYVWWLAWGTR